MPSLEEMNEDFQPSEKFQRKMEALVRDTKRKAEREKRLLNVKRFFITLTAAISIFSCTMLPVKAVREAVITTLIEWHDKFVSVIYVNDESSVTTFHIVPSYIPKGFSQVEVPDESSGFYYGQFSDSHNNWFDILVLPIENTQETFLDNEFSTYYSINFNGTCCRIQRSLLVRCDAAIAIAVQPKTAVAAIRTKIVRLLKSVSHYFFTPSLNFVLAPRQVLL